MIKYFNTDYEKSSFCFRNHFGVKNDLPHGLVCQGSRAKYLTFSTLFAPLKQVKKSTIITIS